MSAERKLYPGVEPAPLDEPLEPFALKEQVAARLAAHRNRRGRPASEAPQQSAKTPAHDRSARIAAAVAERYAQSKSYRAFLAEEAERAIREAEAAAEEAQQAIRQAEAAAEVAALNAHAVAQAQYDLLDKLDEYAAERPAPMLVPPPEASPAPVITEAHAPEAMPLDFAASSAPMIAPASFTVRLLEELRLPEAEMAQRHHAHEILDDVSLVTDPVDTSFLDEEIAFRQSPVFETPEPPIDIPGNLIEFPRQLVAARRARPRLAEGPLREDGTEEQSTQQLRIFEVEAEQISLDPVAEGAAAPEWSSILLGAQPRATFSAETAAHTAYEYSPNRPVEYAAAGDRPAQYLEPTPETKHLYAAPLEVAPLDLRLMSALVDGMAVLASFFLFVAATALLTARLVPGGLQLSTPQMAISAGAALLLLSFGYQYLFFSFSDATPGMRYARIGLCSFSDENPSRKAMRRRILATALAMAPLGLGMLWCLLDEDRLGWHDRISRMYQRSY